MKPITIESANHIYTERLKAISTKYPNLKFKVDPKSTLETHTRKMALGLAQPSGDITMHAKLIGTEYHELLKRTISHELAHLAVGLEQNHNRKFKLALDAFTHDIDHSLADKQLDEFTGHLSYKWSVYANLEDGTRHFVGGVHRKTKKYADYPKDGKLNMSLDGTKVTSFDFEENPKLERDNSLSM
ncbi:hypothetical protein AB4254_12005 [Vibrio breoganii]